jgi:hypothetical protein
MKYIGPAPKFGAVGPGSTINEVDSERRNLLSDGLRRYLR